MALPFTEYIRTDQLHSCIKIKIYIIDTATDIPSTVKALIFVFTMTEAYCHYLKKNDSKPCRKGTYSNIDLVLSQVRSTPVYLFSLSVSATTTRW